MRLKGLLLGILVLVAQPAVAATSAGLETLENRLGWIAAAEGIDVGVAAMDMDTGQLVALRGDVRYPLASVMKIAVAANYLVQVEHGRRTLDDRIGAVSARELLERMMIRSDNRATDTLLRNLGGPRRIQQWLDQQGVTGFRVDRNIADLLRAKRDLYDIRDSATPEAMVQLLHRIDRGNMLRPESRALLLDMMARCLTGKNRLRGQLPTTAMVQNKTGTLNRFSTDVGYFTLPDGRRVAIAVFARGEGNRPKAIAEAARAVYDEFSGSYGYGQSFTVSAASYGGRR